MPFDYGTEECCSSAGQPAPPSVRAEGTRKGERIMTTVRTDVFKLGDNFATLVGDEVKVGDVAPAFTSVVHGWGKVNPLEESKGKVIILSAVPSLDTDTCDRETRRFNEEA